MWNSLEVWTRVSYVLLYRDALLVWPRIRQVLLFWKSRTLSMGPVWGSRRSWDVLYEPGHSRSIATSTSTHFYSTSFALFARVPRSSYSYPSSVANRHSSLHLLPEFSYSSGSELLLFPTHQVTGYSYTLFFTFHVKLVSDRWLVIGTVDGIFVFRLLIK